MNVVIDASGPADTERLAAYVIEHVFPTLGVAATEEYAGWE